MTPQTSLAATPVDSSTTSDMPEWVPPAAKVYLTHVCDGIPIRELARTKGCHASTVLRQIRKIEAERDDPLKDEALERLTRAYQDSALPQVPPTETSKMPAAARASDIDDDATVEREARRILRRLCETKAFLLVSPDMEKAAVFRETVPGKRTRTAVVERAVAQAFALKDWIEGSHSGRVGIYSITTAGRAALKRLLASERQDKSGGFDDTSVYQEQHREFGARLVSDNDGPKKIRYNLAESPLTVLSRKKGPDGETYITPDMLEAGERLREDFELAQMGPRITQNLSLIHI